MKNWLDQIEKNGNEEQKKEIVWAIVKYGLEEEYNKTDDPVVNMALDFILPQIDNMKDKYNSQIEQGKKGGRPKTIDDAEIWRMAHEEGLNGSEIASRLGVPKSTVYSTVGWKERKNNDFI